MPERSPDQGLQDASLSVLEEPARPDALAATIDSASGVDEEAGDRLRARRPLGPTFWLSVAWITVVILGAIFASVLPLKSPDTPLGRPGMGPGRHFLLGTDDLGRDTLARIVYGARVSMVVGFVAIGAGLLIGGTLGVIAGYYKGRLGRIIMGCMDVLLAFPALVLALAIVTFLGQSLRNVTIAIGFLSIAPIARVIRSSTLAFSDREFVSAARALGAKDFRIITREILPNVAVPAVSFAAGGHRRGDRRRGRPGLPRAVGPGAHSKLGRHDQRRPQLLVALPADQPDPRRRDVPDRPRLQLRRRHSPGPFRPPAERAVKGLFRHPPPSSDDRGAGRELDVIEPALSAAGRRSAVEADGTTARRRRPADLVPDRCRPGQGRRRRVVHPRAGQDAGCCRRVRVGQDRVVAGGHGSAPAECHPIGLGPVRRAGTGEPRPRRHAGRLGGGDRHDLPGSDDLAEPGGQDRAPGHRGPALSPRHGPRPGAARPPSPCSNRSASPKPSAASTSTRSSCPAACANG